MNIFGFLDKFSVLLQLIYYNKIINYLYKIMNKKFAKVLIIAGSDSGGGAGIQGDIKTVSALGGYSATAITSITAQNTVGVQAISDVPIDILGKQISSVLDDIGADIIKTGMLSSTQIIELVAGAVSKYKIDLILDPVMISKTGAKLLQDSAIDALKNKLIPKALLVTPNIPEAEIIAGMKISNEAEMEVAAKKIIKEYKCHAVLIKGGHLPSSSLVDILVKEDGSVLKLRSKKIATSNTHGTGCAYASAIATLIAKGNSLEKSVKKAHIYINKAIKTAPEIGKGSGPINHFWNR
jgi:hydroxymethylpyrimidine kinase/phosphomethylpyrimidine kinase